MVKVRADRLCICWAWGAWCALLYNNEETLCWWQAGTNVTDNCQLANGCGYTTCTGNVASSTVLCIWSWTAEAFCAIQSKDCNTLYIVKPS